MTDLTREVYVTKKKLYFAIVAMRNLTSLVPTKNQIFLSKHLERLKTLENIWADLDELGKTHAEYINKSDD